MTGRSKPAGSLDARGARRAHRERARQRALGLPLEKFIRTEDGTSPPFDAAPPATVTVAEAAAILNNHPGEGREDEDRSLARGMVARLVLEAQQRDPQSPVFGVFTRSFAEPVDEATDLNFADFVGIALLDILKYDPRGLSGWPGDDRRLLEEGIRNAALASRRRDVRVGYTNVVLMSIHLMLGAGALLEDKRLRRAGEEKLRRFLRFHRTTGAFEEYNSPCYSGVDLNALVAMADFEKGGTLASETSLLLSAFLRHLSLHFHAPSGELGGPHSRAYADTINERSVLPAYLSSAGLAGAGTQSADGAPYHSFEPGLSIPPDLVEAFTSHFDEPVQSRELVEWIGRDTSLPAPSGDIPRFRLITTYRTGSYVLGTVNEMDAWHQRRNLIVQWRNDDGRLTGLKFEVRIKCRELEENFEYGLWPLQMGLESAFVQDGPEVLGCLYRADTPNTRPGDVLRAPSAFMRPGFEDALLPGNPVAWLLGTHWRQPVEKGAEKVAVELIEAALVPIGPGDWKAVGKDAFAFSSGPVTAGVRAGGPARISDGRLVLLGLEDLVWDWLGGPDVFVPFALTVGEGGAPVPAQVAAVKKREGFSVECASLSLHRTRCPSPDRIEQRTWRGFSAGREILPETP